MQPERAPGAERPLVVLAEDNADWRQLLATALELAGLRVVQVATGAELRDEVLRALRAGEPSGVPDLVLTDVRMPVLSGLAAVAAIREQSPGLPVIFITAFSDAWMRREAARYGALLLDKPVELRAVKRAVWAALAGLAQRR